MPANTMAGYRSSLRTAVYAFWRGVFTYPQFIHEMSNRVWDGLTAAWKAGAKRAGILPDEMTDAEISAMQTDAFNHLQYIPGFADYIEKNSKANKTKLATVTLRMEMWVTRWREFETKGYMMAKLDQKMEWVLGATDKHCFIQGTMITTKKGDVPIEQIKIGDLVLTMEGWKPVIKTMSRSYNGSFFRVVSGNHDVICTDNHPFFTDQGWKESRYLINGDRVGILSDGLTNKLKADVTLPNPNDNKSTRTQINVLRCISLFLRNLPFAQRFKPWMTMPVFSVNLKDDIRLDEEINNEIGLNKKLVLKRDTDSIKNLLAYQFRLCAFMFIRICLGIQNTFSKIRIGLVSLGVSLSCFGSSFRIMHRVVRSHEITNNGILRLFTHAGLFPFSSSFFRRRFTNHGFTGTSMTAKLFPGFAFAINSMGDEGSSTDGTYDGFQDTGFISANGGTELMTSFALREDHSFERITADFTNESGRFFGFDLHPIIISELHLYPMLVYNLEIDMSHNYYANGFLVHNCGSCVKLQGKVKRASQWLAANIFPKSHDLECKGYMCQCELKPTDKPMSKGRLPKLP